MTFATGIVGTPFVWGSTNCVALALRALDAQYGTTLLVKHKHFMTSERRAKVGILRQGMAGIIERLQEDGFSVIPENYEQIGDVQFCIVPYNIGASVILGRQHLSSTVDDGVKLYDGRMLGKTLTIGGRPCLP